MVGLRFRSTFTLAALVVGIGLLAACGSSSGPLDSFGPGISGEPTDEPFETDPLETDDPNETLEPDPSLDPNGGVEFTLKIEDGPHKGTYRTTDIRGICSVDQNDVGDLNVDAAAEDLANVTDPTKNFTLTIALEDSDAAKKGTDRLYLLIYLGDPAGDSADVVTIDTINPDGKIGTGIVKVANASGRLTVTVTGQGELRTPSGSVQSTKLEVSALCKTVIG